MFFSLSGALISKDTDVKVKPSVCYCEHLVSRSYARNDYILYYFVFLLTLLQTAIS